MNILLQSNGHQNQTAIQSILIVGIVEFIMWKKHSKAIDSKIIACSVIYKKPI